MDLMIALENAEAAFDAAVEEERAATEKRVALGREIDGLRLAVSRQITPRGDEPSEASSTSPADSDIAVGSVALRSSLLPVSDFSRAMKSAMLHVFEGPQRASVYRGLSRTQAVLEALRESTRPLSPAQIADVLTGYGREGDEPYLISSTLNYLRAKDLVKAIRRAQWVAVPQADEIAVS